MKCATKRSLTVALAAALLFPLESLATNGMFMIGYGAKSVGMGGTAMGFAQDALAGATNPAAISWVGNRGDVSADLFLPHAKVSLGDNTQKSRANTFLIPNMGGAMQFTRKLAFGFSAVGAGGGGSRYNQNLYNLTTNTNPDKTMGVSLMIMQMNPTVSLKLFKTQSIGVSPVISLQQFRAFGLEYFSPFTKEGFSTTHLTNNGNAYSFGGGLRLGWMGNFLDNRLTVGAAGTSVIGMTKMAKYSNLFAENGDIDTPANLGAGLSFKVKDDLTVAFDVQRVFYSTVNSIKNPPPTKGAPDFPTVFPGGCPDTGEPDFVDGECRRMGLDQGLGFGWKNQTIYKLGAAYALNDQWVLRAGWNYGKSPIPSDNGAILVNLLAPATTQHHATLGATYSMGPNMELTFSYMHAFRFKQFGPTYIGGSGEIGMSQDSFGMGFGFKI